jgi:putative transposase
LNVLDCLPKSAQPAARKALAQIRDAEDRSHAEKAVKEFAATYGAKYPKAVAKITDDQEQLLAFLDRTWPPWSGPEPGSRRECSSSGPTRPA